MQSIEGCMHGIHLYLAREMQGSFYKFIQLVYISLKTNSSFHQRNTLVINKKKTFV